MVKNNFEIDVKVKCIENGTTQAQIAKDIHTSKEYVNKVIKSKRALSIGHMCKSLKHLDMTLNWFM